MTPTHAAWLLEGRLRKAVPGDQFSMDSSKPVLAMCSVFGNGFWLTAAQGRLACALGGLARPFARPPGQAGNARKPRKTTKIGRVLRPPSPVRPSLRARWTQAQKSPGLEPGRAPSSLRPDVHRRPSYTNGILYIWQSCQEIKTKI